MPRPTRAGRKPPAREEVEKASKKVAATTGKKEKKAVEKEILEKPVAPPVRATRSRGTVEVLIETSRTTVASTRPSPDEPTIARRRGQSQQPVVPVAEMTTLPAAATSLPKRSTRSTINSTTTSTAIEEVIRKTPSPKKPTRAAAKVPLHKMQKSSSRVAAAPPTPEITPQSPEIQVPASSDAENHSPAGSAQFASSPPAIMGTAPRDDEGGLTTPTQKGGKTGGQKRISLEFAEDEGYTPPRARPSSAERPRLRELGVESLEPLDRLPGIDENDVASSGGFAGDDEDELASPTPKRTSKWKLSQLAEEEEEQEAGDEADLESVDGVPASGQPEQQHRRKRFGSPFQFQKGRKKDTLPTAVTTMEVEDMTFAIYSDPNTPSPTLPDTTNARELDEIMRPPISSSPAPESPQHSRKRRSSSAGVGSNDEDADEAEKHRNQTRGGKRRKQTVTRSKLAAAPKPKVLQTEDLRVLLPKRKGRGRLAERDEFDLSPSGEGEEEEEDELSKPTKRKSKPTKQPKPKTKSKSKSTTTATAKITKSAWSRPLVPTTATTTTKKTYARKSTGSGKENEAPRKNRGGNSDIAGEEEDEAVTTTTSGAVVELADGVLGKEGRRKLRDAAEKFRIVDAWEMEFEDFTASPSVNESVGGGGGSAIGEEGEVV